ncbi:hypothetical protein ACFE04_006486 [Oxalis oulophora]
MSSSTSNPNQWATTFKDCSQSICSIYCPQWCYIYLPPPPPPPSLSFSDDDDDSSTTTDFSPLIIAVIGILISALVLVSYYTIITNYCKRRNHPPDHHQFNNNNNNNTESDSAGLDESVIKSIKVIKFKRTGDDDDGFEDCSVCLSEFEQGEDLRLLPKCRHVFHVHCIDLWFKGNSTCPVCRANVNNNNNNNNNNVVTTSSSTVINEFSQETRRNYDVVLVVQELVECTRTECVVVAGGVRRSLSLNSIDDNRISIADNIVLETSEDDCEMENRVKKKDGVLGSMRRSFSSGRFMFTRYGCSSSSSSK